jgi:ribosomal 50S subunit-associated protein YjgA (DUF615 family)
MAHDTTAKNLDRQKEALHRIEVMRKNFALEKAALKKRQLRLLKKVLARIDDEKVRTILHTFENDRT